MLPSQEVTILLCRLPAWLPARSAGRCRPQL